MPLKITQGSVRALRDVQELSFRKQKLPKRRKWAEHLEMRSRNWLYSENTIRINISTLEDKNEIADSSADLVREHALEEQVREITEGRAF